VNFAAIQSLDTEMRSIDADERRGLVRFLRCLEIFDRMQGYAALNCGSAFDYLVRKLHLPEGTAWARVSAMRLIRRFPLLEAALGDGRLNPTQLLVLGPVLTAENVEDLVERATHLTKAKTEELRVSIQPKEVPAEGLRKLPTPASRPTAAPSVDAPAGPHLDVGLRIPEPTAPLALVPPVAPAPRLLGRSFIEPVAEDRWQWRIGLDRQRKAKLDTLRGYLGHAIPDGDLQKLFDRMLDDSLEKHGKRRGFVEPKRPRKPAPPRAPTPGTRAPIPLSVRREVLKRDGYRCTETGPDGERCPCTERLEMDHRDPAKLTGTSTVEDLTTKCRVHNNYRAMMRYGVEYVQRRIEARRAREARRAEQALALPLTACEPVARWRARVVAAVA